MSPDEYTWYEYIWYDATVVSHVAYTAPMLAHRKKCTLAKKKWSFPTVCPREHVWTGVQKNEN